MNVPQAVRTTADEDPTVDHIAPLRICLLGYRSNPFSGGQGVYLKYLSKSLVELGHQVDVISGHPYPELDPRVGLIKLPGLNLFEQPSHVSALRPRHFRSLADLTEYFSMLTGGFAEPYSFGRRLVAYLRRHRPHYDVLHDNQSLAYGLLRLQRLGMNEAELAANPRLNKELIQSWVGCQFSLVHAKPGDMLVVDAWRQV